ncbi:MAG: Holliday junction resolvase RuvX [bacterium]|nr:Holliday junction resolvase RuvX [bacterium]
MDKNRYILGIDPGNYKIGLAILDTKKNMIIYKNITKIFHFLDVISTIIDEYEIKKIVLGNGNGYKKILFLLNSLSNIYKNLSIEVVNEYNTSFKARKLYVQEGKNWLNKLTRFIRSFFIEIDDYSAIIILKRYIINSNKMKSTDSYNIKDIQSNKDIS